MNKPIVSDTEAVVVVDGESWFEGPETRMRRAESLLQQMDKAEYPLPPTPYQRVCYSAFCQQWIAVAMAMLVGRE